MGVVRFAGGAGEQCGGGHVVAVGGSETSPRGRHQTQLRVFQRTCRVLPQARAAGQLCGPAYQGSHQQVRVYSRSRLHCTGFDMGKGAGHWASEKSKARIVHFLKFGTCVQDPVVQQTKLGYWGTSDLTFADL